MNQPETASPLRQGGFLRRHPLVFLALLATLAFLAGPLMIAANKAALVLYRGF